MNEELLPCPFCGKSEGLLVQQTGYQWSVCCGNCGVETIWIDGEKAAIARWNRRAQRKPLTDEQIAEIWIEHGLDDCDPEGFARAIEAAHGIKDTP